MTWLAWHTAWPRRSIGDSETLLTTNARYGASKWNGECSLRQIPARPTRPNVTLLDRGEFEGIG